MRFIRTICAAAAIMLAGASMAQAQTGPATSGSLTATLSELERKIIDEYYRIKGNVLGTDAQGQGTGASQRKNTQPMRGVPEKVGRQDAGKGRGKHEGLPPGLAKRDQLPPGLAKRDTLPPGLRRDSLPQDLHAKLPPPAPGTERVLIGGDLVLIDIATNAVLDIMAIVALKTP